jgi:hypothetical protein
MVQMDLGGHPPFPLNHHFEPLVLINHDIYPFDGECNVMSSSFVNYTHHESFPSSIMYMPTT